MSSYFANIARTTGSLLYGLKITFRHFLQARKSRKPIGVEDKDYFEQKDGIVTLQYPFEEFPVPTNGRYQLHNEIDDCIVCDKCAKICPVNCIDIEPVRAVEEIGKTSDGTSKRIHAAKFDIDMSKCCFCGLCTVVCPTECLTMTKEYDFSVFDLAEHNFAFSEMTEDEVKEKKQELEVFNAQKEKEKAEAASKKAAKPAVGGFKPKVKPVSGANSVGDEGETIAAKPAFKPKVKPVAKSDGDQGSTSKSKPVFKPKVKPVTKKTEGEEASGEATKAKPVFKPKVKPVVKKQGEEEQEGEKPKAKPVFKPKIKPKAKEEGEETASEEPKKKPVFRPKIKPKNKD